MGRRTGSRNTGYFYRAGRGWFTQVTDPTTGKARMIALRDEKGEPLRSKSVPVADRKAARDRSLAGMQSPANEASVTVLEVCDAYLAKAKDSGAAKTYNDRADTLFDFCYGYPPRFRKGGTPAAADRIHKGYADMAVAKLLPLHVDQWLAKHETWNGGRRSRVQALKRAFNYGVDSGLIAESPLMGYKIQAQNARVTYLTPEQEKALIEVANTAMAVAIQVCIRTGARPGCEFAKLTAAHVRDHGERMEWTFAASESKTKRERILRITDPAIIKIVRERLAVKGPIFRNSQGGEWTRQNLSLAFRKAKERLVKKRSDEFGEGQDGAFDADACMYSCRHTYAKRILQGYWSGKQTNIETLARLMGNSVQVCRDHYLKWTDSYNEPLWESA